MTKPYDKLTARDFKIIREVASINIKSSRITNEQIKLIRFFEETNLNKKVINQLKDQNIHLPSPVQMQTIPLSLLWKDIICVAPTGSGKTLAFLIPLINFLLTMPQMNSERSVDGPYAIVLGPTRELVIQLQEEFDRIGRAFGLKSEVLVGGRSKGNQASNLNQLGVEVIFGTVGRTRDAIESSMLVLNQCFYVVIDEADSMFSMDLVGTPPDIYLITRTIGIYSESNPR